MANLRGTAYALISSTTFGLIPLFTLPLLHAGMSTSSIIFYRFALAAFFMGMLTLVMRQGLRVSWAQLKTIIPLGLLYGATSIGLLMSYTMIPSGMSTTIHFLYPILVSAIMVFFFHEARSKMLMLSAVMSLVGVGLMSWSNGAINYAGVMTVLCTVVTYAVYIVWVNRSNSASMEPMPFTFYVLLVGAVMFFIYAMATTGIQMVHDWSVGVNVILLALVPTVVSDLTLVLAVKNVGSTVTAILGSMEPMTAVIIGVLYFGEPFGGQSLLGLILILTSVTMVVLRGQLKSMMAALFKG